MASKGVTSNIKRVLCLRYVGFLELLHVDLLYHDFLENLPGRFGGSLTATFVAASARAFLSAARASAAILASLSAFAAFRACPASVSRWTRSSVAFTPGLHESQSTGSVGCVMVRTTPPHPPVH